MVMGANYSFELISIETYAPQFIEHNKFFLGRVYDFDPALGFYFFSIKITKKKKCVGNNEMIDLIKSVQADFLQTFITTKKKMIYLWN